MDYASRNRIIAAMGYADYEAYLQSPLWKSIRGRVYEAKGRACLRCKVTAATQVHHTRYDEATLRGDTLNNLVPICGHCHQIEHGLIKPDSPTVRVIKWNGDRAIEPAKKKPRPRKAKRSKKSTTTPRVGTIGYICSCGVWLAKRQLCTKCNKAMSADQKALHWAIPVDQRQEPYRGQKRRSTAQRTSAPPAKQAAPVNICSCGNVAGRNHTQCGFCRRGGPKIKNSKKAKARREKLALRREKYQASGINLCECGREAGRRRTVCLHCERRRLAAERAAAPHSVERRQMMAERAATPVSAAECFMRG